MAVHDGAEHVVRALESVLNQPFGDIELVAVDCASADRTASILERFHDRDIRVELLHRDDEDIERGLVEGIESTRGSYVMLVRPDDWLATELMGMLVRAALEHDLQLVFPARSEDLWDPKGHSITSTQINSETDAWCDRASARRAVVSLYETGLISQAAGVLVARDRACSHRAALTLADDGFGYIAACLDDAERVGTVEKPAYHAVSFGKKRVRPFDPSFAARCTTEHSLMMGLLARWGLDRDPEVVGPVHRRHVRRLIECIDNASVGGSRIPSAERLGRVQEMLDDEDARASLAAVQPASREFGIMYKPMTRRDAAGCCVSSRLREFARISHLPFGFLLQ